MITEPSWKEADSPPVGLVHSLGTHCTISSCVLTLLTYPGPLKPITYWILFLYLHFSRTHNFKNILIFSELKSKNHDTKQTRTVKLKTSVISSGEIIIPCWVHNAPRLKVRLIFFMKGFQYWMIFSLALTYISFQLRNHNAGRNIFVAENNVLVSVISRTLTR